MWLISAILLIRSSQCLGIIAYDCNSLDTTVSTYSLVGVGGCQVPTENITTTRKARLTVIQEAISAEETFPTCMITVGRHRNYCGWNSYISLLPDSFTYDRVLTVSVDECRTIHRTGVFSFGEWSITGLKVGPPVAHTTVTKGSVDQGGNCEGISYMENGKKYKNLVEFTSIKIFISQARVVVDIENKNFITPNGIKCSLKAEDCLDPVYGIIANNFVDRGCRSDRRFFRLMAGKAVLTESNNGVNEILLHAEGRSALLTVHKKIDICGAEGYELADEGLFAIETTDESAITILPGPPEIRVDTLVNTKLTVAMRTLNEDLTKVIREMRFSRCQQEEKILWQKVTSALKDPAGFAYSMTGGPGHLALVKGEVIHVVKCQAVNVTRRLTNACYQELPVQYAGKDLFLTQRDRILVATGTEIDCNSLTPVLYKLGDFWVSVGASLERPVDPVTLTPHQPSGVNPISPMDLQKMGVYSPHDVEDMVRRFTLPREQENGLLTIGRVISQGEGSIPQGSSILHAFSEDEIQAVFHRGISKVWGWLSMFGTFSAGVIGLFWVIKLIQFIVDSFLNGALLYRIYGFSWVLLASVWNNLTHLILRKKISKKTPTSPTEEELRECQEKLTSPV